uniref:AlNc14C316G10531 protein n=1 Tax=Albugo laibachii Nc14 TaxID=890382 RepID=F0WW93_9STRA|nr:AlNc14C316G10531 [Albugo laibachii Nc14]|eukprot:CCA25713.1 AlNc14C316G10531 [Albugo laibachii Nc14]
MVPAKPRLSFTSRNGPKWAIHISTVRLSVTGSQEQLLIQLLNGLLLTLVTCHCRVVTLTQQTDNRDSYAARGVGGIGAVGAGGYIGITVGITNSHPRCVHLQ